MTEPHAADEFPPAAQQRLRALIEHVVAGLTDADRAERIAWCRDHNQHGVRAIFNDDDGTITLTWGGSRLAVLDAAVLYDDNPRFAAAFMPDLDRGVPDEWLTLSASQRNLMHLLAVGAYAERTGVDAKQRLNNSTNNR